MRESLCDEAARLYRSGLSVREVGEQMNRSYGYVYKLLDTAGEPRRQRGRRKV